MKVGERDKVKFRATLQVEVLSRIILAEEMGGNGVQNRSVRHVEMPIITCRVQGGPMERTVQTRCILKCGFDCRLHPIRLQISALFKRSNISSQGRGRKKARWICRSQGKRHRTPTRQASRQHLGNEVGFTSYWLIQQFWLPRTFMLSPFAERSTGTIVFPRFFNSSAPE